MFWTTNKHTILENKTPSDLASNIWVKTITFYYRNKYVILVLS